AACLHVGDLQAAGPVGYRARQRAVDEDLGATDVGLHDDRGLHAAQRNVDRTIATGVYIEVHRLRLVAGQFEAGPVATGLETDGAGRRGADVVTVDVDVCAARRAGEGRRTGAHLLLQVGRDRLNLVAAEVHRGGESVVTVELEANVMVTRPGTKVERGVAHELAIDVGLGAAGRRLQPQGAELRLRRAVADVVQRRVGNPVLLRDRVDDDREALDEALLADVTAGEEVIFVAEARQLPGVELGLAGDGYHLREAAWRGDVELVAAAAEIGSASCR